MGGIPFVIGEPGLYVLDEDLHWTAPDAEARAIHIASDDVVLDLNHKSLRQIDPPVPRRLPGEETPPGQSEIVSGNVGIWAEGRRGVTIRNGTIGDVQGVGIALKDCSRVELTDLTVRGCGGQGVVDTSFLYRNGGIFVMGTKQPSGDIRFASGVRLRGCVCEDNTSALDYVVTLGSLLLFCRDVEVSDCRFNGTSNTSPQPSGVQFNVVGVDLVVCHEVIVRDCEADGNHSGGEPAGFFAWGENYRFERCRARGNYTATGNRACGFNISNTDGLEMIGCEAHGNYNANPAASADHVRDFSAAGFRLGRSVTRGSIRDCRATGNTSLGRRAPAAGFVLNGADDVVLVRCTASGNFNEASVDAADGLAAGFLATVVRPAEPGPVVGGLRNGFIDCVAEGDESAHSRASAGFLLQRQRQGRIDGCRSSSAYGSGVLMQGCEDMQLDASIGPPDLAD